MDYSEQQQFLQRTRVFAATFIPPIAVAAIWCWLDAAYSSVFSSIVFGFILVALALSLCYSPSYLHLTVNRDKRRRWQIRIRWRILVAIPIFSVFSIRSLRSAIIAAAAMVCFVTINLVAKAVLRSSHTSFYFWAADLILIVGLFVFLRREFLLETALLAAGTHLAVMTSEKRPYIWAVIVSASGALPIVLFARWVASGSFALASTTVLLLSAFATALLTDRAQQWNRKNIGVALQELTGFTGYSADRVWTLWSTSDRQLAENWQNAKLDESDAESMKQWYRDNSELYMFAISAYNLEYKRICSNLAVLRQARGGCLDYGAGNGELVLEIARRGQRSAYYDVEGRSMAFAHWRAQKRNLNVEFFSTKDGLRSSAQKRGFDTVFSFDVLEHLPDLPGELDFLSSLLAPAGVMVFDVPAGATKSHPMHLNHNLNVRAYLLGKGLKEKQNPFRAALPFKKEEKYLFQARA